MTLAVSVTACAKRTYHTSAGEVETAEPKSLLLSVENENFYDMNVYVVSGALGTRVGMVSGNSRGSFVINRSLFPTGEARFVALPIGGYGRGVSDMMSVYPGSRVEFRIGSNLALSHALIRR